MCDLKEVFGDHIDYLNKYHFYPRLAKRAAEYISKQDDIQVLLEILEEVALIAYEWCSKFYFAYGSNMDQKQMLNRCPTAKCFGKAKIDNYRFIINARGVASIIPWEGSGVEGLVWCIFNQDEEQLDIYEGIVGGYYFKDSVDRKSVV